MQGQMPGLPLRQRRISKTWVWVCTMFDPADAAIRALCWQRKSLVARLTWAMPCWRVCLRVRPMLAIHAPGVCLYQSVGRHHGCGWARSDLLPVSVSRDNLIRGDSGENRDNHAEMAARRHGRAGLRIGAHLIACRRLPRQATWRVTGFRLGHDHLYEQRRSRRVRSSIRRAAEAGAR